MLLSALSGCAWLQDNPTACKIGSGLLGATLGGVGGGVGVANIGDQRHNDNGDIAAGAARRPGAEPLGRRSTIGRSACFAA